MVHIWNPSIWEVEAGGLGVQCQHQLHGEFRACLCYIGSVCLSENASSRQSSNENKAE